MPAAPSKIVPTGTIEVLKSRQTIRIYKSVGDYRKFV